MVKEVKAAVGNQLSPDKEIQSYNQQFEANASEAARLERLLLAMSTNQITEELLEVCPELAVAYKQREKLRYRKGIIEKALSTQVALNKKNGTKSQSTSIDDLEAKKSKKEENKKTGGAPPKQAKKVNYVVVEDYGSSILGRLTTTFERAVADAYPGVEVSISLNETSSPTFGDYQCNSAMALAGKLKQSGVSKRPAEVAKAIVEKLPKDELIEKVEIAPAGFINIFLNQSFIVSQILSIASSGVKLPKISKRKVLVDFSSPNIAKEMHVGHLRSTIIGDSICRLFEALDFDVLRVNHIGDWGTQFGMLIAHLFDEFPDFMNQPPPIADLQAFYKESKKRFDEDGEFKKRAYECVVRLQSKEKQFIDAWKLICDISVKYNQGVYDRLDIKIENFGESEYQDMMVALVEDLKKNHPGILREEEGRLVMFPTGCDIPLTVVKSDGGNTYDTSDMAALKYRLLEKKVDWAIYVVDSGQSLHLETVYAAGRDLGWYDSMKQRVEHVGFGLVLGDDKKKFKTRSGETVRLLDLLDQGVEKASGTLAAKDREKEMTAEELIVARDAVAYGCIKYADLSHTRTQDYVFSFDRMLDDKGNTAVYLLYSYARIRSILRKTGISQVELESYINSTKDLPLTHPCELKLAKQILKLSDVILLVTDSLMMHQLCDYVYQLSSVFSDFYRDCYVVEKLNDVTTINYHRLVLCEVTANVMSMCFKILGIREVPKL